MTHLSILDQSNVSILVKSIFLSFSRKMMMIFKYKRCQKNLNTRIIKSRMVKGKE